MLGPFSIHHVQNSGIAFGLFASATAAVIVLTTVAVAWMLVFFARSGARHPLLPVAVGLLDRRQRLEPRRPRPARPRHRLPRLSLLAGVQPRRQLHRGRRRHPARGPRRRRPRAPPAACPRPPRRVPESAAGERLDRFLAALPEVGSRAAAERLIASAARRVDGVARPKSHRLAGGEEVGGRAVRLLDRRRSSTSPSTSGSPTRTSTCSSSTSPPGSSSTRARDTGRDARPGAARSGPDRRRPRTARDRPPARPRHLGPARRRALSEDAYNGLRALVRGAPLEREYLALVRGRPRSRSGRIEAPIGRDRREPTRMLARHATRRRRRSRSSRSSSSSRRTRSSACGSRPAAPTRSASTWRRSGCPSPATRSTASRGTTSGASSCTRRGSPSRTR